MSTITDIVYPSVDRTLEIKIIKEIPKDLKPKAIEKAVSDFIAESHVIGNEQGIFEQTIESIANATFLNGGSDFWFASHDGEVAVYIIARVVKDIDNKLTYWVNQAWVHRKFRGDPIVKKWWNTLKRHAVKRFCKHLVIVSSRNPKAYERWFGTGMKEYATLMMEDLN